MDYKDDIDLTTAFKKLGAENKSLQARLEEYAIIINSRDREIDMLQKMLTEANEYRSSVDNELRELKELQQYLGNLQLQATIADYVVPGRQQRAGEKLSAERQLENLRIAYTDLQSQLTELQKQLLEMNSRNLQLQLQTSRIAELESRLANAEEERDAATNKDIPGE